MEKLRARFGIGADEIDYEALKARALYPDLIGRTVEADANTPHFMNCDCGMLVMTSELLAGERTECRGCQDELVDQANREMRLPSVRLPPPKVMSKRGEGRVLRGLVLFCIVTGSVGAARFMSAPPRAQAVDALQLD